MEAQIGGLVQASLGIKQDFISKITKASTGGKPKMEEPPT
jgi:hypothetical protein